MALSTRRLVQMALPLLHLSPLLPTALSLARKDCGLVSTHHLLLSLLLLLSPTAHNTLRLVRMVLPLLPLSHLLPMALSLVRKG